MEEKGTAAPNYAQTESVRHIECPQTIAHSRNLMRDFFFTVYQTAKAGAEYCFASNAWRFNNKVLYRLLTKIFYDQMPEDRHKELFGESWKPTNFARVGQIEDFVADIITTSVSESLKAAAQKGFANAFEQYHPPGVAAKLAEAVFLNTGVFSLFRALNYPLRSDLSFETERLDNKEMAAKEMAASIQLVNDAREYAFQAMEAIYSDQSPTCNESDSVLRSILSTLECHDKLRDIIMLGLAGRRNIFPSSGYVLAMFEFVKGSDALIELSQAMQILSLKTFSDIPWPPSFNRSPA